jgi:dTDP-glucose pyrophosphorylase
MIFDISSELSEVLDFLGSEGSGSVAFIVRDGRLAGSITDGDIRRSLSASSQLIPSISNLMNSQVRYIIEGSNIRASFKALKREGITHVPLVHENLSIIRILNAKELNTVLPVTAVIMAGGLGSRLAPLTDNVPKPLLKVGKKSIIDYTFDRLVKCGVISFFIPVKYKADMIINHFENMKNGHFSTEFFIETEPLGTIGSLAYLSDIHTDYVLLTNADVLTNINYEKLYEVALDLDADIAVSTISYEVDIPYAVVDTHDTQIVSLIEKPKYSYQCNSGIYLIRKELLLSLEKDKRCDAPDFIELNIAKGKNVIYVNNDRFWLDIGKHKDFELAQSLVKEINFD